MVRPELRLWKEVLMTEANPVCMCGTRAIQAYNDEGVKIPKCVRCGNEWPDSRAPMERMREPSSSMGNAPARIDQSSGDLKAVRVIAWIVAIVASGVAIIYWVSANTAEDLILSAVQGTQVATEAMAIAVVPTCIALAIDRMLR